MTRIAQGSLLAVGALLLASLVASGGQVDRITSGSTALLQVAAASGNAQLAAIGEALKRGDPEDAELIANRLLRDLGDRPDVHLAVGVSFAEHGYFVQAASHFGQASKLAPSNYIIDYNLGLALFRSKEYERAAAVLKETVAYQDTAEVRHLLADVYEQSGRYIEALREYENAVRLEPDSETYWFALAYEFLKHRTHDGAANTLETALERFPKSYRLHLALGITYFARRQYGLAAGSFITASDLEPTSVGPYRMLAAACDNRSEWGEEAVGRFQRLMRINPATAWGPYLYGLAREESLASLPTSESVPVQKDLESLYLKSIALDSGFAEARYRLGRLYRKQGRLAEAVEELEGAILERRDWPEPRYELARSYMQLGRKDAAETEFRSHRELLDDQERKESEELQQIQQFLLLLE